MLACKLDCVFDVFLAGPSIFAINKTVFAAFVLSNLNPSVSCRTSSLAAYIPVPTTASAIVANLCNLTFIKLTMIQIHIKIKFKIDEINLMSPTQLGAFSANDSLLIAAALANNNRTISKSLAASLGSNIPLNTSVLQVLAISSAIPLECFSSVNSSNLVNALNKMDLGNMDTFRKSFITSKVGLKYFIFIRIINKKILFLR